MYVVLALPIYSMQVVKIPAFVCSKLDAHIRSFWWGSSSDGRKPLYLKAWDDICKPQSCGGLGFRKMLEFNKDFLAKWGWNLLIGTKSLCLSIMRSRYLHSESFLDVASKASDLSFWKDVLASRDLICEGASYLVGDGEVWLKDWNHKLLLPRHKLNWWQFLSNCFPTRDKLDSIFHMVILRFLWSLEAGDNASASLVDAHRNIFLFASILFDLLWKYMNSIIHGGPTSDPTTLFDSISSSYM
ncbi:hypothetical protein UlMin_036076 [Ulmus minor]